jgi:ribokinase
MTELPHRDPLLVVVGSANLDIVVPVRHIPYPGETVVGDDYFRAPGGKGSNQAVACARLGGHTFFVGCLGG